MPLRVLIASSLGVLPMPVWAPQPGPQAYGTVCPAQKIMFGGSRGGGKTDCALGRQLLGAQLHGAQWNGLILRRRYKDFAEIRRRIDELITAGLPALRIGGEQQENYIRFANGASVTLSAIGRIEQADAFQGQQFTEITIEEATTCPFLYALIDRLNGCLRSPHGVPCHMFFTGNPGGPGHMAVKTRFIDPAPPLTVHYDDAGESHVFIPSSVDDNLILSSNDPTYVRRLKSIKDPVLRRAWLLNDWSVNLGQAFGFDPEYHVIAPMPVPEHAPVYMTFDWGWAKPFSVGWWWVDSDGRLLRFGEWYGCGEVPDDGLRLEDSEIAEGIVSRESKLGLGGRDIIRLCDPTCHNRKPARRASDPSGVSTAEVFARHGLYMSPGDPSRALKIRQFRERLRIPRDPEGAVIGRPMLQVYSTCTAFQRTIPYLCMDEMKPEDVDTAQEDHIYDSATLICMARPLSEMQDTRLAPGLAERMALG